MTDADRALSLLSRLSRLAAAESWSDDLNPAQRAALDYLSRANRFSRAPSHVADYLGTTRGTASQTLKALARKGYVTGDGAPGDRRSIAYRLTGAGRTALAEAGVVQRSLEAADPELTARLAHDLEQVLTDVLRQNGGRTFGICRSCRHFAPAASGGTCRLLSVPLRPEDTTRICHEHAAA